MRLLLVVLTSVAIFAGHALLTGPTEGGPYDSGGPLIPEQAAYDVTFYDLSLRVDPADSTIAGALTAHARITAPTEWFVLDLDPRLDVSAVTLADADAAGAAPALAFERREGKLWIHLPSLRQPGERTAVRIAYGGRPRVAPNPPWDGGFTWARTADGAPWIATTCQSVGADVWWPVKDHPSDEPDSMALHVTVPAPLVVAANGRLRGVEDAGTDRTYHWFVSTPINVYTVALNIAPYRLLERSFRSVGGETFPIQFYVLPEDSAEGARFMPEIVEHLRFFEETLGPYPFRADKYGVAQTPHLGMEHQTIIAYGAGFDNGAMTGGVDWGFDALHHHELAHEWWGNLVTNADWRDLWLHEGFGTYMQALFMEHREGLDAYHAYMDAQRPLISNRGPLAPRSSRSTQQIFGMDPYMKGAWVLHTLRYLVGDDAMATALRRMAYPDSAHAAATDGRQCRFATTDDFVTVAEEAAGAELDWFFEVYARQPDLPRLTADRDGDVLHLYWDVPEDLPFPMPVDVHIDGQRRRIAMPDGEARIAVPAASDVEIDPERWVLRR